MSTKDKQNKAMQRLEDFLDPSEPVPTTRREYIQEEMEPEPAMTMQLAPPGNQPPSIRFVIAPMSEQDMGLYPVSLSPAHRQLSA